MPGWFMGFCFSGFHRCRLTQSWALVHLHRFLPPCPAVSLLVAPLAAARIPCSHPSPAHVQPAELSWSECAFSAGELAVLQDFATPVLPSDVKRFVEEADLNTSVRVEPSFSSSVKGVRLLVRSPKCVGFDSFPYYLLSTWTISPCRCSARWGFLAWSVLRPWSSHWLYSPVSSWLQDNWNHSGFPRYVFLERGSGIEQVLDNIVKHIGSRLQSHWGFQRPESNKWS